MNKKYALCVGNNYPGTGAELYGCVNDANDWAQLLGREGYQVTVMTEAGKAGVLEALGELVARSRFGDRVVFTFSGHGTWVPDRDGDEADGRDEALVMAGLTYTDLLRDDELQTVFSGLGYGTGALVLSDSCHSGTVTRYADRPQVPAPHALHFMGLSPAARNRAMSSVLRSREGLLRGH